MKRMPHETVEIDWITDFFERKYKPLDARYNTMKMALEILYSRCQKPFMVETGCLRQRNDWGAGMSTFLFGDYLDHEEVPGFLHSVDISDRNVKLCQDVVKEFAHVRVICMDSAEYLEGLPDTETIDFLYLDSWDFPIIEIADQYASRDQFLTTFEMLRGLSEEEFLKRHGKDIAPCQDHCLKEIEIALPHLSEQSVVLIDDVNFPGGGKGRLAEQFLKENGWVEIMRSHQSLWIHENTHKEVGVLYNELD